MEAKVTAMLGIKSSKVGALILLFAMLFPIVFSGYSISVKAESPAVGNQNRQINVEPEYAALREAAVEVLEGNVRQYEGYNVIVPHLVAHPIPYCWNTYFDVIGALEFNTTLARESINALFATQRADGMIPNAPTSVVDQDLHSQAPLISEAIVKYYQQTGDLNSVKTWYPKLIAYFNWYTVNGQPEGSIPDLTAPFTGRRAPNDGGTAWLIGGATGLNNHPVFDETNGVFVKIGNYYYLEMEDLLLSSSMALFAKNLADLSTALGLPGDCYLYTNAYNATANAINNNLWQDSDGLYHAKAWNGRVFECRTQEAFLPMVAGVPNAAQANMLVKHLQDPTEYNLPKGIPTVSANSKYYTPEPSFLKDGDPYYWRGSTWAPMVYLTYLGLKQYGYDTQATSLALKWINLVKDETSCPFAEYYDSRTGRSQSQYSNFSWTAAVTLALIDEECSVSQPTSLSIQTDAPILTAGSNVSIFGALTDSNGEPLQGKTITLSYAQGNESWNFIGSELTDRQGNYNIQWLNTNPGTFTVKAEWSGDKQYSSASNMTALTFLPIQNQAIFKIESNSTVYGLIFNSETFHLSFNVTGPAGTTGYVNATIAKSLLPNSENLQASIDGKQLNYTIASTTDSWVFTLYYSHSTHQISLQLAANMTSTEGVTTALGAALIITLLSAILAVERRFIAKAITKSKLLFSMAQKKIASI